MFAGERAPTGPDHRSTKSPPAPITVTDDPALPEPLTEPAAAHADETDTNTTTRELPIARKTIGWWQRQGWIACDPTIDIERRLAPPDRTKALSKNQMTVLWRLDVSCGRRRSGRCPTSRRPAPMRSWADRPPRTTPRSLPFVVRSLWVAGRSSGRGFRGLIVPCSPGFRGTFPPPYIAIGWSPRARC
ncbi:hypothetical protein ACFQ10_11380 [Streptomyces indonesiensis]